MCGMIISADFVELTWKLVTRRRNQQSDTSAQLLSYYYGKSWFDLWTVGGGC